MKSVTVCPSLDALGQTAGRFIAQLADKYVTKKGRFSIALSGGSTPRFLYDALSRPPLSGEIPWGGVILFWGDERCVPEDHPDSNFGMANTHLLSKIPIPSENIFAFPLKMTEPSAAASAYEDMIYDCFDPAEDEIPSFDLMILGLGADGHTASLFPDTSALKEKDDWVVANPVEKLGETRLTFTYPLINQAKHILFLAAGKEKSPIIKTLLSPEQIDSPYPASQVVPVAGQCYFFIDDAAADALP